MRESAYSLIRYIGDTARNEPLNVGIVLWEPGAVRFRLDDAALQRVITHNPHLDRKALDYLEEFLDQQIDRVEPDPDRFVQRCLEMFSDAPVVFGSPHMAMVGDEEDAVDRTMKRLLLRLVHPPRRVDAHGADETRGSYFRRRFRPLIERRIVRPDVTLLHTASNIAREVNFYANTGRNVAFDIVNLDLADFRAARERVDAQAGKIHDLLGGDDVGQYLIYFDVGRREHSEENRHLAISVLSAAGANVVTENPDVAAAAMEERVGVL
jgi:hypothetical protein